MHSCRQWLAAMHSSLAGPPRPGQTWIPDCNLLYLQELVAAGPQGIHAHVKALLASQAPTALPRSRRQGMWARIRSPGRRVYKFRTIVLSSQPVGRFSGIIILIVRRQPQHTCHPRA